MRVSDCMHCCKKCAHQLCVQKVPVFSSLSREELAHVFAMIRHQTYKKGETLFSEEDSPDALVIVNEGSVKAYKLTPDGREQILYVFSEGDFFGERSLFGRQKAAYAVQALEPVKTCSLTRDSFHDLLRAYPEIAVKIIEELVERIAHMESALQSIGVRSVDGRICALLLEFAQKHGKTVPEGVLIRLPLSREGMANYLGIARETLSRKLGQLEDEGWIRSVSYKSILLLDTAAVKAAAGLAE